MKNIRSVANTLNSNIFFKSTVKKLIPKELITKVNNFLNKDMSIRLYFDNKVACIDLKNNELAGVVPVFYWDRIPNFGDLIGPYLIFKITGKPVLNIKNMPYSGIMSVGSIIQMLDRNDMVIWGSGLMYKLTDEQMTAFKVYNPKIISVRGRETANCLLEAGISVPDQSVYGDPALILPLFYNPKFIGSKKIGICPHYSHKRYFMNSIAKEDNLEIVDVQLDVENVVDAIASLKVCISTSLHGLIIAQAYNIPWVWLEICDNNLLGEDFKFRDFFSTLDKTQVSHIKINLDDIENIDYRNIAKQATLPNKLYDENSILEALKSYLNM